MITYSLAPLMIALIGVAASIAAEHLCFAVAWRHYELPRRTLGIATVLFWFSLLALASPLVPPTAAVVIWVMFGTAGAITAAGYTIRLVRRDQLEAAEHRALINKTELLRNLTGGGGNGLPKA